MERAVHGLRGQDGTMVEHPSRQNPNRRHPSRRTLECQHRNSLYKDLDKVEQDGLDAFTLPLHVLQSTAAATCSRGRPVRCTVRRGRRSGEMVRQLRRRRPEQVGSKHDREVRPAHLVDGVVLRNLVEVAHQELERRIVRVGQLVDPFVESDVPQAVVFDLCAGPVSSRKFGKQHSDSLAASMNAW